MSSEIDLEELERERERELEWDRALILSRVTQDLAPITVFVGEVEC